LKKPQLFLPKFNSIEKFKEVNNLIIQRNFIKYYIMEGNQRVVMDMDNVTNFDNNFIKDAKMVDFHD